MKYVPKAMLILAMAVYSAPMLAAADADAGKAVFLKKCATCHGQAGEGKDAMAKMLKVELRHLGSKEVQSRSDAELKKTVVEGTGKMKPVKDIDDKTADDIVAYLRTLAKK
jgi:mono/diheme cytochrome c family protein